MQKNYIAPQTEVMQLSSDAVMQGIGIVRHSGGKSGGGGGFDESEII